MTDQERFIRIHTSDTATFKRCRRRWDWTSPNRGNLRPKVSAQGINFNLAFGTIVHKQLERYYAGDIPIDEMRETFEEDWLALIDRVRELNEGFFTENWQEFERHQELGMGMLGFYATHYANELDDFDVISTEHDFAVDTGLRARDRESGEVVPVLYCGRMDMVLRDKRTGRYGIMDHKTSARHDDEDYFDKLDMDEQVTRYVWAAQLEAWQDDLPYKKIDFVLYNVLFKAFPKPPSITSRGFPSIDRQKESTTEQLFKECILSNPLYGEWLRGSEKGLSYLQYLIDSGTSRFVRRELVKRNGAELAACGERVFAECQDMLSPELRIYPNVTGEWYCLKCPFRGPCIAAQDGSDVGFMLEQNYESNMDSAGNYTLGI